MDSEIIKWIVYALIAFFIIRKFLPVKGVDNITTNELKKRLTEKNVQFIDVRTLGEYNSNRIKQFTNIPLHELKAKADQLDKDKEVIVICMSGSRSMQACRRLKGLGFEKLTNVSGGMANWS